MKTFLHVITLAIVVGFASTSVQAQPSPLVASGHPVEWVFVYKFNSKAFPGCKAHAAPSCPFGGTVQDYVAKGRWWLPR